MPQMDGFAVMAALRDALPVDAFVPVIMLTGDKDPNTRLRALHSGAKDFLTKPFDAAEVTVRVRNLLETRALYMDVRRRNAALAADLAERADEERRAAEERRSQRERIDRVLSGDALTMVLQPIANLHTGAVVGLEALARFECEPRRPPNEWFDEAAAVGRGADLEFAALRAALAELERVPPGAFLSVNISPTTACLPELTLQLDGLPADRIVLELTEPASDGAAGAPLIAALDALRLRGVRVAADAVGAGYADLDRILHLHPDIVKLDVALIRDVDTDPVRRALCGAMVAFAGEIGVVTVAEGIETAAELEVLRGLGIPWGQGQFLGRPGAVGDRAGVRGAALGSP